MSWLWHLIGPLIVFLAIVFPLLIATQDHKPLDRQTLIISGAMTLAGICFAVYFARYSVVLTSDGFTFRELFSEQHQRRQNAIRQKQREVICLKCSGELTNS